MWIRTRRDKVLSHENIVVHVDFVNSPTGEEKHVMVADISDDIVVVPIEVTDEGFQFVLVEKYRYPLGVTQKEFPSGYIRTGELKEQAAKRILLDETGYVADNVRFVYRLNTKSDISSCTTSIYIAAVREEKKASVAGSKIFKVSDDELLGMMSDNEIADAKSVAALAAAMLQGENAKKYISNMTE